MPRETREVWAKRVERWKDSGLTASEYAAENGIKARSLTWWRWHLGADSTKRSSAHRRPRRAPSAPTSHPLTFVEVAPVPTTEPLEVVLTSGRQIRVPVGFDSPTFERLLGILERS